jgi:hypothetical protein
MCIILYIKKTELHLDVIPQKKSLMHYPPLFQYTNNLTARRLKHDFLDTNHCKPEILSKASRKSPNLLTLNGKSHYSSFICKSLFTYWAKQSDQSHFSHSQERNSNKMFLYNMVILGEKISLCLLLHV